MNVEKYRDAIEEYVVNQHILKDTAYCRERYGVWVRHALDDEETAQQVTDTWVDGTLEEHVECLYPLETFKECVKRRQQELKHILVGPVPPVVYNDLCYPDEFMKEREEWRKEFNE